jgi:hypothetical protein
MAGSARRVGGAARGLPGTAPPWYVHDEHSSGVSVRGGGISVPVPLAQWFSPLFNPGKN